MCFHAKLDPINPNQKVDDEEIEKLREEINQLKKNKVDGIRFQNGVWKVTYREGYYSGHLIHSQTFKSLEDAREFLRFGSRKPAKVTAQRRRTLLTLPRSRQEDCEMEDAHQQVPLVSSSVELAGSSSSSAASAGPVAPARNLRDSFDQLLNPACDRTETKVTDRKKKDSGYPGYPLVTAPHLQCENLFEKKSEEEPAEALNSRGTLPLMLI